MVDFNLGIGVGRFSVFPSSIAVSSSIRSSSSGSEFMASNSVIAMNASGQVIHMDIDGHPPFPSSSKQFSDNFGNLLFLAF